jgi:hypothetical protein
MVKINNMKTHKVIDMVYHEDEGNGVFCGTEKECYEFMSDQGGYGYKVVPLLEGERISESEIYKPKK